MPVYVECGCAFYLVGDHGLYSRDVVGLRGYRVEVEGLGWRCGCHVWLLPVGGRVRPGLVVVRVVWGMRALPAGVSSRLACGRVRLGVRLVRFRVVRLLLPWLGFLWWPCLAGGQVLRRLGAPVGDTLILSW